LTQCGNLFAFKATGFALVGREWCGKDLIMRIYKPTLLISLVAMVGCSTSGTIESTSDGESQFEGATFDGELSVVNKPTPETESHRVFHQAATGFVSVQSIRQTAERRVDDFCGRQGKSVRVLSERTSKPPHILGNFPRIEIEFECIAVVRESAPTSKYDDLAKLKKLLDSGAINESEYEAEKAKLLQMN
jgi:hypothetical protein